MFHQFFLIVLLSAGLFISSPELFAQNADSVKSTIYSKLKCCPCPDTFETCTCAEAKEMKAYIDGLLESNVPEEEVFYKLAKKYSLNVIIDTSLRKDLEERLIKEAGEKHPRLQAEPLAYDLGKVSKKDEKIKKIFKIVNQGNSNLVISRLKTSCPCATVSLTAGEEKSPYFGVQGSLDSWQLEIKPGENAALEFVIDLADEHVRPGKLIRETSIMSNDPLYPEMKLKLEAEVTQ